MSVRVIASDSMSALYHTAMAALDVEGIHYCPVCGGSDGEHDWETHTAEIRATSDD